MQRNPVTPPAPVHRYPVTRGSMPACCTLAAAVLLTACTSVPLPPWMPGSTALPPASSQPSQPSQASSPAAVTRPAAPPAPAPQVVVTPVPAAPPAIPAPQSATSAPYSAAVAARFPAPSVIYNTPGLQPSRNTYSTQGEIQAWLREQASAASRTAGVHASVITIGRSQRGETLEALVLTRAIGTDPVSVLAGGKPTVLLVGQQHGDEPAGSEALLVIARELSQGLLMPMLERINVVIVPRANPDGAAANERVTAGGVDMNRDHLLLSTPEAQALAQLGRNYRPTVVVDSHEYTVAGRYLQKFGTVQKFDAMLQYATTGNLPEFLTKAAEEWYRRPLLNALKGQGLSSEWYYTTSSDIADKKISMGGTLPDTGRNVNGLKNAVSLLIETRGVGIGRLHIQRRVHTHVTAISSVLASTFQRSAELTQLRPYLDKEVAAQACKEEGVVEAAATAAQYDLAMLDPVTGADKVLIVDWDSALQLRKVKARVRPCGYWLSASSTQAVDRLRMQGVQVQRIAESGSVLGESYREVSRTAGERQDVLGAIAGSGETVKVQVSLVRGVVDAPRGSYYVSMSQPLANLVIAALEPDTQSSFFANRIVENLRDSARAMSEPSLKFDELP